MPHVLHIWPAGETLKFQPRYTLSPLNKNHSIMKENPDIIMYPEDQEHAEAIQASFNEPAKLVKIYLYYILPLITGISNWKYAIRGESLGMNQFKWGAMLSWIDEQKGYPQSTRFSIPSHLMGDQLSHHKNTDISPSVELYILRKLTGLALRYHMTCERCEGLGHWRPGVGGHRGRNYKGQGIYLLGDPSLICNRCQGFMIDPTWMAELEDSPPDAFKKFKQLKAAGKIETHYMLKEDSW